VIIGVMSDTHGRLPLMFRVAEHMTERHGAERVIHLGDDYADALELIITGYTVHAVPGLWCPEYETGSAPKTLIIEAAGISIACAHSSADWGVPERKADILLCGHTHRAAVNRVEPQIYLNPGHLRGPMDRGERAYYGIIRIATGMLEVTLHELDGSVRAACTAPRCEAAT